MNRTRRLPSHRTFVLIGGFSLLMGPVTLAAEDTQSYESTIGEWRRSRAERLTAEDGWLSLIGLFWLEEGVHTVGSGSDSDIALPASKAPSRVGTLTLTGDRVHLRVTEKGTVLHQGKEVSTLDLIADTSGSPTILDLGDLQLLVIERAGRYGLRVRDRQHPARFDFPGIEHFPIERRWQVTGRLETYVPRRTVRIPNVLGQVSDQASPGTAVFEIDGIEHRLDALEGPNGTLYLIFADQTSGRETYGGGRFLYSDPVAEDGSVVLDFNKAYNPPCAFTDHATCPLPPRQNKLTVRIEAGEKRFGEHP